MRSFGGKFTGLFHVYEDGGKRYIEELIFYSHEDKFLSETKYFSISDEFHNGDFKNEFLLLEEVDENKSDDFYFEIYGEMGFSYTHGEYECQGEVDCEMDQLEYEFRLINERDALILAGIDPDKKDEETIYLRK